MDPKNDNLDDIKPIEPAEMTELAKTGIPVISDIAKKKKKKRLIIILSIVGVLIIALAGTGIYFMKHGRNFDKAISTNTEQLSPKAVVPTPTLYPAILDGVMTDQASANRHPLGVMIENHPDARPQSGLDKASIVYEAMTEGGITRFLAIFGENQAERVGPIRSARTYFVDWAHGVSAYLAHVGGNIDALDKIQAEKTYNLDQFIYPAPYARIPSPGLALEHTMYSTTSKLWAQAQTNGYPTANNFNVYKFKDDPTGAAAAALPSSQRITVNFSSSEYAVYFNYDKASNSYKRFLAGKPQVDAISKAQITPKNIIVMWVKRVPTITRINEAGYNMTTIGSGKAQIYIDGKEIIGTWQKSSAGDREKFLDASGQEITFNRGQFWICVVPPGEAASSVTVTAP